MDPATGRTGWHVTVEQFIANAPTTYYFHGRHYLVAAANDMFYASTLPPYRRI